MSKVIVINRKTPIALESVAGIEAVTAQDIEKLAARYEGSGQDFAVFNSAVRLVDGSTRLAVQPLRDFLRLTGGRMLDMGVAPEGSRASLAGPLVPYEAIRHLEAIRDEERAGMKAAYGDIDPKAIDAKRTRINYRALDPANPKRNFQKTFQADIQDDLIDRDGSFLIDIGGNKFVLADEIEDARPLSESELKRLSRKYALRARTGEPLVTSIVLAGDELILSSLSAQAIETLVERPLPSLQGYAVKPEGEPKAAVAEADPVLG